MDFFIDKNSNKWQLILLESLLVILVTFIIAVLFQFKKDKTGTRFPQYAIGKYWQGEDLVSNKRFQVLLPEEKVEASRDSVRKEFIPFYIRNDSIVERIIQRLDEDSSYSSLSPVVKQSLKVKLSQLYKRGVMYSNELKKITNDSLRIVRSATDPNPMPYSKKDVLEIQDVYRNLLNDAELISYKDQLFDNNLEDLLHSNLVEDTSRNAIKLKSDLESVPLATGWVEEGDVIIEKGRKIDEETYNKLKSYDESLKQSQKSETPQERKATLTGEVLTVLIMMVLFTCYLHFFRKKYFNKPRNILMLYSLIVLFCFLTAIAATQATTSIYYIIPYALVPIMVRVFLDSRTAFATHVTTLIICTILLSYDFEFFFTEFAAGLVAIFALRDISNRGQILRVAILSTVISLFAYYTVQLMMTGSYQLGDKHEYWYICACGLLLMLAYPLMFLFEKLFNFTSSITLIELSNTNKGLLRRLSEVAPGTFVHSINVGNLAAEIANRIDADGLLVRTGALYHDIGKLRNPVFYTENQKGSNPHDSLTEKESASIIISHVLEGQKLCEEHNLPDVVKNFILTHHGLGVTKYFYIKYQQTHPDEVVNKSAFMYPGPNPFTREQAILMMTDSVEAASRSLKEYNEESISKLVNNIIDSQVRDNLFTECPITFRDITVAKQVLIEKLKSMYHTRISYPEQEKKETDGKQA